MKAGDLLLNGNDVSSHRPQHIEMKIGVPSGFGKNLSAMAQTFAQTACDSNSIGGQTGIKCTWEQMISGAGMWRTAYFRPIFRALKIKKTAKTGGNRNHLSA